MASADYKNIERLFNVVVKSLFQIDGTLSYTRTLEAIERLCAEILKTETDETVWYIGESGAATLDSVIVGSFWFMTDYHGGQDSLEYRVYSRLGEIFKPGMTSGPEPESSESDVYEQLKQKSGYVTEAEDEDEKGASDMRVTTISKVQEYGEGRGRLILAVSVDGVYCQDIVVCSRFSIDDTLAVHNGTMTLGELIAKVHKAIDDSKQPNPIDNMIKAMDESKRPYSKEVKRFNILDHNGENVLGGSVPLHHCYINEYGAVQPGEKLPKNLEVGESTWAEYRMNMTKLNIYRIVRVQ